MMIITLITKEGIHSISLPKRVSGQYWLDGRDGQGHVRRVLSAEGIGGEWILRGAEGMALLGETGGETQGVCLKPGETQVLSVRDRAGGEKDLIFVEPSSAGRQNFRKYCLRGDGQLSVGRSGDNQIVFDNKYVSGHHARLIYQNGAWSVVDTQSSNGTFVNGRRAVMEQLRPGDVVYIMGLKILIGGAFFAVNDPDDAVTVDESLAVPFVPQPRQKGGSGGVRPQPQRFFRSPRFGRSVAVEEIRVDAPPSRVKLEEVPLALLLGPAITMGITSVVMGAVAVNNVLTGVSTMSASLPTIIMSVSMLCGTLLWPLLTKRSEKKKKIAAEQLRQSKYQEYLDSVRDRLGALKTAQAAILAENYPPVTACAQRILERQRGLWERTAEQEDFLRLRLGCGELPLAVDLRFPEERFALEDDYLMKDLARLRDEPKRLENVPITLSLQRDTVCGVVGEREELRDMVKGLILQIAALHSPQEVKLIFLVDQEELEDWAFVRWLPHCWDDKGSIRFLAATEQEVRALSAYLERELSDRLENMSQQKGRRIPRYVTIAVSRRMAEKAAFLLQSLQAPAEAGFSCLALAQTLRELPKECTKAVKLSGGSSAIYDKGARSGEPQTFRAETAQGLDLQGLAVSLANVELDTQNEQYQLPGMLSFLEMYGVGKVEHLNSLTRWKENNPVNSLQVPVGVGTDGELFMLDLHEKFHGPHGLVAGMTGSGKSEFIITFILSLALNYSPNEVAFILIDYKGGGLAGAFEDRERGIRLPHLAGTITNLDGGAVKRSLISIQSELRRRQAIFNEARRISGEGTIDIYKYQKMYRSGQVTEAVPHLFIISDEFAELKTQQPEFMEQLISAARIGRSLGVHLILATQKPSGVVDDQIWSNSRFRVCLKVQERSDSMDMIKRPDAAALAETGRFYLQVGFNEYFAMGQSAWSGAPYCPADRVSVNRDDSVAVIDHLGRICSEARPKAQPSGSQAACSQVVAIVHYLSQLAEGEKLSARQLWLDAIPDKIYVDQLREKYAAAEEPLTLAPVVGEYDDPFNQRQDLLRLRLSEEGNALIYGAAGSGKVTLLTSVLYDLLRQHRAEELNVYILDLGEESLQAFERAPQVGDVLFSVDSERIAGLFKLLGGELKRRKRLFAEYGGDLRAYCRATGELLPHILVVIHNYSVFAEQFEPLEDSLSQLARDGAKYGISFLVTAASASAVRYRIVQNFKQTLVLQLNDVPDYVGLLGSTDGVYPSAIYGRGIFKTDRTYEFQTAHACPDDSAEALRAFAARLDSTAGVRARKIPTMPERVDARFLEGKVSLEAFPVGVEKASLQLRTWDIRSRMVTVLAAQDEYALGEPAQAMAQLLSGLEGVSVSVLDGRRIFLPESGAAYTYVAGSFTEAVDALFQEMVYRNNAYKTAQKNGEPLPEYGMEVVILTGMAEILESLSAEGKDRLNTLMEKAELPYQVRFILCDITRGITALTATGWYKRFVGGSDGIWAGDGISDQYALRLNKISSDLYGEVPAGYGYAVSRGRPTLMKLLSRGTGEEEEQ